MEKLKKITKKQLGIIIAVIAAAALAAGILIFKGSSEAKSQTPSGVAGVISPDWDSGIENSGGIGEDDPEPVGVQLPGYSYAVMNSGDRVLHLSIGNPAANQCGLYATLKLEDGTVLYSSELLKPGYGLTEVPLSQTLKKGEYSAAVLYRCVALDEEETPMNSAESGFVLIVN